MLGGKNMRKNIRNLLKNIIRIESDLWLVAITFAAASVLIDDIHGAYQHIKDALSE